MSLRRLLVYVSGVLALLAGIAAPAAATGPTVGSQGDVRVSKLPSLSSLSDGATYVGADSFGESYRGLIAIDGAFGTSTPITLVMVEDGDAADARNADTAVLIACATLGPIETGHTAGPGPDIDCETSADGRRELTGTWRFDVAAVLGTPGATGVALVAVAPGLDASFTVVFDQASTALDVPAPAPATSVVSPTSAPVGVAPPASPHAQGGSPSYVPAPAPTVSVPGIDPPTESTPTSAPAPVGTAPQPTPSSTERPRDLGRLVLVAGSAGAAAAAFAVPPSAFVTLGAFSRRRRKESSVDDQTLRTLDRRYRFLTGGAIGLALVVLAAVTATGARPDADASLAVGGGFAPLDGATTVDGGTADTNDPAVDGAVDPGAIEGATAGAGGSTGGSGARPSGAGGSSTGGPAGAGPGPLPGTASGPLTASDQGVTPQSVRIATIILPATFYARFGIPDPKFEELANAYAAEINATGGINGRRWEPVFVQVNDPTNETQIAQACREAFADQKVFLMVNSLGYSGLPECAAKNGRILSDTGYGSLTAPTQELMDQLGGRYQAGGMTSDQLVKIWADIITETHGSDTKIGIVENDDAQLVKISGQLQAQLAARGFPKPSTFRTQADPSTAAVQTNNGIARFRSDGVQLVVPLTNPIAMGIFQNGAEGNGYRPEKGYTLSSFAGTDNEDFAGFWSPAQMNGAKGPSLFRSADAPEQARCKKILAARSPSTSFSAAAGQVCHMMFLNHAAMTAAGPELTAASWSRGFGALGTYNANAFGTQTFSPAKHAGADQVRIVTYQDGEIRGTNDFRG